MARGRRAQQPEGADGQNAVEGIQTAEIVTVDDSISAVLLAAIQAEAPGPRRGALEALHTAVAEVKHRARGLDEHLSADFRDLLDRIHAL
jgi:hypothetical protein